jgi:PTH1 family peptidyl-tRNA hydrolase
LARRLALLRRLLGRGARLDPAEADPASGGPVLLLVGLGNPGPKYARTRHNVGFMALDEIVRRQNLGAWRSRFQSEVAEGLVGTEKVLAMKPQTYMNNSGQAIGAAARFYKLTPDRVVVFYDELDLAPGKVRVRTGGGAAGHNGIKSTIQHLGADFVRVRIGIGHPGDKNQVTNWVLSDFSKTEAQDIAAVCAAIGEEVPRLVSGDREGFMSRVAWRAQGE